MRQEDLDALIEKNKLTLKAMKKQTAVDLLRDRLFKEFGFVYSDNIHDELKAMEKQQIIEAYKIGYDEGLQIITKYENVEEYYTSTYGQ